jgi:hypothetical protein
MPVEGLDMSNNIGRTLITENQAGKEVSINDADGRIDAALTEIFTVDTTAGNVTVTTAQLQQAMGLAVTNATAADRTVTLPGAVKKFIHIRSSSSNTKIVSLIVNGVTLFYLYPGDHKFFQLDGANGMVEVGAKNELRIVTETLAITLGITHANALTILTSATDVNVTVNNSVFKAMDIFTFIQGGAGKLTFVQGSGVTINKPASHTRVTAESGAWVTLFAQSASVFWLSGGLG